jgi:hypothetical protein
MAVIDLCTLEDVKSYLGISASSSADDDLLEKMITSVSQFWLTRTSRSTLNSVQSFTERYDGNGKDILLLRQWPIVSVTSLSVDGRPIPQSPDFIAAGWAINPTADAVVILGAGNYGFGYYQQYFAYGRMNVAVTYEAGYNGAPADVADAARKQVAVNFKRKSITDQASISLPQGGGTTTWRSWEVPPEVECVIQNYRRMWP